MQLKELLESRVVSGELRPGDRIPTQRELMAHFKLSYSTVSRALQELVREGLVTRVPGSGSRVAEPVPPPSERGPSFTYHLIGGVPSSEHKGLSVFRDLLEAARERGARVEPHEDLSQAERAALVDRILTHRARRRGAGCGPSGAAEGIVFPHFAGNRPHIERLREAGAPYIVLDVPLAQPGYSIVLRDHRAAARTLAGRLLKAGHRPDRIGLILGFRAGSEPDPSQWDRAKMEGAAEALGGLEPRRTETGVAPAAEAGERAAAALLRRAPGLTALFCDHDERALGVMRHLAAQGRRVPDDVSLVCFNRPRGEGARSLSCAWAPAEGVGRAAAEALWAMLSGRAAPPLLKELPMRFEDGRSIAPPCETNKVGGTGGTGGMGGMGISTASRLEHGVHPEHGERP